MTQTNSQGSTGVRGHEDWHKLKLPHCFGASHDSLHSFVGHKGVHTHNAGCFGGVWGVVCKASAVARGDGVWFLVTEAHGIHRLTSIADYSLEREKECIASLQAKQ